MAPPTIVDVSSGAEFHECNSKLYSVVIQQPVRRLEGSSGRHHSTIALLATSPEGIKLRLQVEGLLAAREHCLQVGQAGTAAGR